jgi:hypothetical protein
VEYFTFAGPATITLPDIEASESLFLLYGTSYASSDSLPEFVVNFPSYQFASSAYLAIDGNNVQTLNSATTN